MSKKVLVVDDDMDILTVIKTVLKMKGFNVETVSEGEKVLGKIDSFDPDILLLDVMLSGLDGRVICKQIKANPSHKELPILMLSAHPAAASTIAEYGADGFIN